MITNLERYKAELEKLIELGENLIVSLHRQADKAGFEKVFKKKLGEKYDDLVKKLPNFNTEYQYWYSESKALIKQLLPDRLDDFVRHYEKPKSRKSINYESYRIEDALQGIAVTETVGFEKKTIVGIDGAIPHVEQQVAILRSVKARFESSLFDIRQLVQADLFDSELGAADELLKQKFTRAAGALAGVVLERHLAQVCDNHSIRISKKAPGIADLNEALKSADVVDVPQWRFNQHLADIRNLCDHSKKVEPTPEQVADLIAGVTKVTKTLF